ncbi:MAG: zinc ribbon domain-containing protein [Clostridiales bacterium]|nr:zinc ribbon domain-containing protein [Clostridiales bacterium]
MAFCTNCGVQIDDKVKFCPSCGEAVNPEKSEQQQSGQFQRSVDQGVERLTQIAQDVADVTEEMDQADVEKNKAMGGLAYILFFLPLVTCPDSKYARFHANQGLLLLILVIAANMASSLIRTVFRWGLLRSIASIATSILFLAVTAIAVIGLINGFTGKAKELPVIGKIRIIK